MKRQTNIGATLSFDLSQEGRVGVTLPALDVPESPLPAEICRTDLRLPELSQMAVMRYFTILSGRNFSIDTGFYPLGSCSMKLNPRINEHAARLPGFANLHPLQPVETVQGALELMFRLQQFLAEITGMDGVSLVPKAGAQGELAGILVARAYHQSRGEERNLILIPDSAHGTNPATAAMAGFQVKDIQTSPDGNLDIEQLKKIIAEQGSNVAALMITQPSTLGLFEQRIEEIAARLHEAGALLYMDGANMNALVGKVKPGEMGVDLMHFNLHKTFSTPHGGGGPGAGPLAVKAFLIPFLPEPYVEESYDGGFNLVRAPQSIGRLGMHHGNFGMLVRAYTYIRSLGAEGLAQISEAAVLNANYVQARLRDAYALPYDRSCMHEVVISASRQKANSHVSALDIAKRLIDYGFHPPTMYFPLTVPEALMIEPTESESKEGLDSFCDAMLAIALEAEEDPELLHAAPHDSPVRRLDEATAARKPILRWTPEREAITV